MPMTPSKRFRINKEAEIQSKNNTDGENEQTGNAYELQLIQLSDHKRQLKQTQSIERKKELKAKMLPDYEPYVSGILEADSGAQDEIMMTIMLWRIDAGDISGALEIAEYALRHNLTPPEQFKRDTATLIAEEVAEQTTNLDQLVITLDLTRDKDMPDEVRAKLHKAIGINIGDNNYDEALHHLNRALELHQGSGVKKLIEQFTRAKKKSDELKTEKPETNTEQKTELDPEVPA